MTEPIRVERIIHTIHAVLDIHATRQRYMDLFGAIVFAEGYHEIEDRDMNLMYVANHMVEPMAPRDPQAQDKTFARYLQRYGEGFQSIEFGVEDARDAARRCKELGAQLTTEFDSFFFVHPKSTRGVILEVCDTPMPNDPYDYRNWNPNWVEGHPSTLRRLAGIGCVVRDLEGAAEFFTKVWDGNALKEDSVSEPEPLRRQMISIGGDVLCLATPAQAQGGPVADYMERRSPGVYSLIWQVDDLGKAKAHFERQGARTVETGCLAGEFMLNPEDIFGARHEFTTGKLG